MRSSRPDTVIGNARIVLADRVIERGWIAFADGRIAGYGEGKAPAGSADAGGEQVDGKAGVLADAIAAARDANLLRSDHFLHLRCEIPMPSVVEEAKELIGRPDVRLMSLMDHTPGQRQFRNEAKLRDYYRGKGPGMTDAELDILFERRFAYQKAYATTNMREIVALARQYDIPLASHDDTTEENVTDAVRDRVSVAEFPTTMEAARGLHLAGIGILMGAP